MSARCMLTGAAPVFGNRVSHSHRRTRRRWNPNIQHRRYWLPGDASCRCPAGWSAPTGAGSSSQADAHSPGGREPPR
ncbi:MAG: 50S ribosomal protein L28 [Microbispora sp.]|nr:50S ribosomal protein L28 [Microbispora sp.]